MQHACVLNRCYLHEIRHGLRRELPAGRVNIASARPPDVRGNAARFKNFLEPQNLLRIGGPVRELFGRVVRDEIDLSALQIVLLQQPGEAFRVFDLVGDAAAPDLVEREPLAAV